MLDFLVLLCSQDDCFIKILLKKDHLTGTQTFDEENTPQVNVTSKDERHYSGQGGTSQYKSINTSSYSCTSNGNKSR
jgi:hypothetical protein